MQLSKNEEEAYEILKKNRLPVFKIKDLVLLLNINPVKTYNLIKSLKKKRVIDVLSSGIYSFKDTDDFVAGAYLNWPSYVSFLSALNYYGFSDNLPKKLICLFSFDRINTVLLEEVDVASNSINEGYLSVIFL